MSWFSRALLTTYIFTATRNTNKTDPPPWWPIYHPWPPYKSFEASVLLSTIITTAMSHIYRLYEQNWWCCYDFITRYVSVEAKMNCFTQQSAVGAVEQNKLATNKRRRLFYRRRGCNNYDNEAIYRRDNTTIEWEIMNESELKEHKDPTRARQCNNLPTRGCDNDHNAIIYRWENTGIVR